MVDGRKKGAGFENDVCRLLSHWIVPGDWSVCPVYKLPFRRRFTDTTPLDGHWNGEGDVLHRPGVEFPFCVECKDIEGWELDGMFKNEKWPVWGWWRQAQSQSQMVSLRPILFFTRRFRPVYVMVSKEDAVWLRFEPVHGPVACVSSREGEVVVTVAQNLLCCKGPGPSTAQPGRSRRGRSRASSPESSLSPSRSPSSHGSSCAGLSGVPSPGAVRSA